jgi:hypothetical protein
MFAGLLGPRSFDSPWGPLVRKQASFPITFGGIGFVSTSTITRTIYLRSWAFVIAIIVDRFMLNQHPFLLEALAWVDNDTFPFEQHFKVICDFYHPQPMHVFFHLNNSSCNKWFNFKIPSQNVYTIIPFLACSWTVYLRLIMPEFFHLLAQGWVPSLQFD